MTGTTEFVPSVLLPCVGLSLLLFFLIVVVRPSLASWATTVQKFSGFGVSVEIALITVVLLIGVGLLSIGVWLQVIASNRIASEQLEELERARRELVRLENVVRHKLRPMSLRPAVELAGAPADLRLEDLKFEYHLYGKGRKEGPPVEAGLAPGLFSLKIPRVDEEDFIEGLILTDTKTGAIWGSDTGGFGVLSPRIKLKRQSDGNTLASRGSLSTSHSRNPASPAIVSE